MFTFLVSIASFFMNCYLHFIFIYIIYNFLRFLATHLFCFYHLSLFYFICILSKWKKRDRVIYHINLIKKSLFFSINSYIYDSANHDLKKSLNKENNIRLINLTSQLIVNFYYYTILNEVNTFLYDDE